MDAIVWQEGMQAGRRDHQLRNWTFLRPSAFPSHRLSPNRPAQIPGVFQVHLWKTSMCEKCWLPDDIYQHGGDHRQGQGKAHRQSDAGAEQRAPGAFHRRSHALFRKDQLKGQTTDQRPEDEA